MANHTAATPSLVLLVDDDEVSRVLIGGQLTAAGYEVIEAENIDGALNALNMSNVAMRLDSVILDRALGSVDGLGLMRQMKARAEWKSIPVIMLTAHDKPEKVEEGLKAGIFYYLAKPVHASVLISVIEMARQHLQRQRNQREQMRKYKLGFARMESSRFEFSTLEHVEHLASFVANCFPDPQRVLTGIAELTINAIEHGILGISYEEKNELLTRGVWLEEISRRQQSAEQIQKKCELIFTRRSEGCYVTIRDPGRGFSWRNYLGTGTEPRNPGRGIAQAAASFDSLVYNETGNEAVGFLARDTVAAERALH